MCVCSTQSATKNKAIKSIEMASQTQSHTAHIHTKKKHSLYIYSQLDMTRNVAAYRRYYYVT